MRYSTGLALFASAGLVSGIPARSRDAEPSSNELQVDLGYVRIEGERRNGVDRWLGVQYAQPPVGKLRWMAPQPVDQQKRDEVVEANQLRSVCIQIKNYHTPTHERVEEPSESSSQEMIGSEDCLFLDISAPSKPAASPLPVLVNFQGQHQIGSQYYALSDYLIKRSNEKLIYVSVQYRVGPYGFLSSDELQTAGTANAGVLDQRAALEWVQKYIDKFGGDPKKVTIQGFGVDGASVMNQMIFRGGTNKETAPFQAALINHPISLPYHSHEVLEEQYSQLLKAANCNKISCLRDLSEDDLKKSVKQAMISTFKMDPEGFRMGKYHYSPTVDGEIIRNIASRELQDGNFIPVPLMNSRIQFNPETMAGTLNQQDLTTADLQNVLHQVFARGGGDFVDRALALYPESQYPNAAAREADMVSDILVNCPSVRVAQAQAMVKSPVYKLIFHQDSLRQISGENQDEGINPGTDEGKQPAPNNQNQQGSNNNNNNNNNNQNEGNQQGSGNNQNQQGAENNQNQQNQQGANQDQQNQQGANQGQQGANNDQNQQGAKQDQQNQQGANQDQQNQQNQQGANQDQQNQQNQQGANQDQQNQQGANNNQNQQGANNNQNQEGANQDQQGANNNQNQPNQQGANQDQQNQQNQPNQQGANQDQQNQQNQPNQQGANQEQSNQQGANQEQQNQQGANQDQQNQPNQQGANQEQQNQEGANAQNPQAPTESPEQKDQLQSDGQADQSQNQEGMEQNANPYGKGSGNGPAQSQSGENQNQNQNGQPREQNQGEQSQQAQNKDEQTQPKPQEAESEAEGAADKNPNGYPRGGSGQSQAEEAGTVEAQSVQEQAAEDQMMNPLNPSDPRNPPPSKRAVPVQDVSKTLTEWYISFVLNQRPDQSSQAEGQTPKWPNYLTFIDESSTTAVSTPLRQIIYVRDNAPTVTEDLDANERCAFWNESATVVRN